MSYLLVELPRWFIPEIFFLQDISHLTRKSCSAVRAFKPLYFQDIKVYTEMELDSQVGKAEKQMKGNLELKPTKICKMCSSCFTSSQMEPLLAVFFRGNASPPAQGYQRASKNVPPQTKSERKTLLCPCGGEGLQHFFLFQQHQHCPSRLGQTRLCLILFLNFL